MSTCDDCDRLRARIHEIQNAADKRNAELHRKVAYYEAIRDRTNELLNRFTNEAPRRMNNGREVSVIEWFADILQTQPLSHTLSSPGSVNGFWIAFQQVLEADGSEAPS